MYDAPSQADRAKTASPRPVVVGNDGSHWGQAALWWAAEHAWRTGAVLDVWLWDRTCEVPDAVPANGGLNYDATANQYNYVWKTQSTYANKCFKFDLVLKDGTSHLAYFKFLK